MSSNDRRVIRESKWERVFELGDGESYFHESKFLFGNLNVSLLTIKNDWPAFTIEEKVEFARAFSVKRELRSGDEEILSFLMATGPEEVWITIALRLTSHPDSGRVTAFLLERIQDSKGPRANYFQALEKLRATESIPILRKLYDEYGNLLSRELTERDAITVWTDYLACCKALLTLTQDPIFLTVLKNGPTNVPTRIHLYAAHLLREIDGTNGLGP
jgi:hypothetical protein